MDLLIASNTVTLAQADSAPATGTPGWATDGNPATNTPATIFPAYAFNAIQGELTGAIESAGIALDRTKLNQLALAMQAMTQGAMSITAPDTGIVNALSVALAPMPALLTPGMSFWVTGVKSTSTGAATVTVATGGGNVTVPIELPGGAALAGGELVAGYSALLRVNEAGTAAILLKSTGKSIYAATNGSAFEVFNVAPAVAASEAVQLAQSLAAATLANETANRVAGTVYTNPSALRPLLAIVSVKVTSSNGSASGFMNGNQICQSGLVGSSGDTGYGILLIPVPPDQTYEITVTGAQVTITSWWEWN
ncbi:MAG: hypothetical protein M0T84_00340 [Betaproteobacteria bacterium]|nr:hypothetical protein [Betaproteobacteria bacterium]